MHLNTPDRAYEPNTPIYEIPQWGAPLEWQEANSAIEHLVRIHGNQLTRARCLARAIERNLALLFPLMDELCMVTCRHCPTPCCLTATVWLDFRDLLYLHLSGQKIPPHQLIGKQQDICKFSSPAGCLLSRFSRPWVCTLYLCPVQTARLRKKDQTVQRESSVWIQEIKSWRKGLESDFIRVTGSIA